MAPAAKRGQAGRGGPAAKRARRPPKKASESEVSSDGEAASGGGGELASVHATLNAPHRVKQLERENAELRAEVEDLRAQLATYEAPIANLTYTVPGHTKFMKDIHTSATITLLDLTELRRQTNSFTGDWYPQWKPDKKLDALTTSLVSGASNVKGLDLGDARWAMEDKYVKELKTLLVKYKKTLSYLRVTARALVERYIVQKTGKAKYRSPTTYVNVDVLGTVASCPKLERLAVVFSCGFTQSDASVYNGDFNPRRQTKNNHFAKLKEVEVYLTKEWAKQTLGQLDTSYDSDTESGPGDDHDDHGFGSFWEKSASARAKDDELLTDLLKYRAPFITLVDMKDVAKYKADTPSALPDLLGNLAALRSISLRAEWLPAVSDKMKQLEAVEVVVSSRLAGAVVESVVADVAASESLKRVKRLHLSTEGFKVKEKHSALLRALAERCCRLEVVCIKGCGWKEDDLTVLLEGGAPLRELHLNECSAVEAVHLPLMAAIKSLAVLRLPGRMLGKPGYDALDERVNADGLDLRYVH